MLKKMKVDRNFVEWLAEILPEYQHEDVSELGENIHRCLGSKARSFTIMFKPVTDLKALNINLKAPKLLIRAYFHNLILVKIVPRKVNSTDRSA